MQNFDRTYNILVDFWQRQNKKTVTEDLKHRTTFLTQHRMMSMCY